MKESNFEEKIFFKYLKILEDNKQNPSLEYLKKIVHAQISKIPFENISKLFFKKRLNLTGLIDLELYLEGIEKYNFGGTCYATNFYFNELLKWLGFDVKLCGAAMKEPDVHLVNIVKVDNQNFLIDTGYAAPFFEPLSLDLLKNYTIYSGNNLYKLKPRDKNNHHQIELYRNGELIHGYKVNPTARHISEFQQVIEESFNEDSMFMNSLLISRFDCKVFITVHNMTFIEIDGSLTKIQVLDTIEQLTSIIENRFGIPRTIFLESIQGLGMKRDCWSLDFKVRIN